MKQQFLDLEIKTNGQKLYEFTNETINWIKENNFMNGTINLVCHKKKENFLRSYTEMMF